jgi:hypothetical protein
MSGRINYVKEKEKGNEKGRKCHNWTAVENPSAQSPHEHLFEVKCFGQTDLESEERGDPNQPN